MISDLNTLDENHFVDKEYDVAICGAGVAGITLARRLSKGLRVALCEAGGLEPSQESQELYQGGVTGAEYFPLHAARLRYFGGTSNHWAGYCRALDAHDFEAKAQNPNSGWPISKAELDTYTEDAMRILELSSENTSGSCPNEPAYDLAGFEKIAFWWSPPTRFGKKYRGDIEQSANVDCYLNANAVDLRFQDDTDHIAEMHIRDYSNRQFAVRAKRYILAAGGLENPRILLNCNSQRPAGIGNQHDLVGRYFAEHLHYTVGRFILEDGHATRIGKPNRSAWSCFYGPTTETLQTDQILNFGLRIRLFEELQESSFRDKVRQIVCSGDWTQDLVNRFRDRNVSCLGADDGTILVACEQALNRESRVLLNDDRDRFDLRRIDLDWVRSPVDKRTLQRAGLRIAEQFALNGIGRVKVPDWLLSQDAEFPGISGEQTGGWHHMCTTRMAEREQDGVVDSNLAVFGTENLYIAGSSVFSTSGHANPTYTIVQLTLRLADHLNRELSAP